MTPTGRLVALVLLAVTLAACTSDDGDAGPGAGADDGAGSTETISIAPGAIVYRYANAGLVATLDLDANTLEIENGTGRELPRPNFYVLAAVDGAKTDGSVLGATAVPAGQTATFDVELTGIAPDEIGLVVLLMGKDNYGAFVRQ